MTFVSRGAAVAVVLIAAIALQIGAGGASRTADAQAANLVIPVGTGEVGYAVNLFPELTVTVERGSTLTFTNPWFEPHTVTFPGSTPLPPPSDHNAPVPTHPGQTVAYDGVEFVNSGFFFKDQSFEITMATNGTHEFFCIIHPGMQGAIEVVDPGSAGLTTQAEIDASAEATFGPNLAALKALAAEETAKGVTRATNVDGSTTWTIVTGEMVGPSDVQQFFPAALNIQVGDTVVWHSTVPTPHTATFLGGADFPVPPSPENPAVMLPTEPPAAGYNGVGYLNSGIIGLGWPSQTYATKFSAPGSFPYICVLHIDQGMGGVVNVAGAPVAPAATGSGGFAGIEAGTPWTLAGALLLLAVVVAGAARLATRTIRR